MPAHWQPVVVAAVTAIALGLAGGVLTEIGPWYRGLRKPSWQPPDWLFAPAWTLIYVATATAAVLAWRGASAPGVRTTLLILFEINVVLNFLWTPLFFRLKRPDWAFLEVIPLWLSCLSLVIAVWPVSRLGGILLLPYLTWVAFAAFLNWTIVRLNPRRLSSAR